MRKWVLLIVGWMGLCAAAGDSLGAESAPRPNIVLIFIDDMGYGDIGPFGNKQVKTPALDKFAAEGMKFTSFYATPVCSMSRACLMTGCYNARVSMPGVLFPPSRVGLNPDELTVAEVAKQQGYATACIGKWHLGHLPPFLPTEQGFDTYFGIPYSNDMTIDPPNARFAKDCVFREGITAETAIKEPLRHKVPLMRGNQIVEYPADQATLTQRYTEEAIKFMRENKDKPFFVYLPHTMVHIPLAASERFRDKSGHGLLGDAIEELDWSVGEIMKAIKELQLDEKTLVIFTSDNGAAVGSSAPWRGKKGTNFEGGVREPCLMRWPGKIPAGSECSQIAGNIDVLPTVASLVGTTLPTDRTIDGRSLRDLMLNPKSGPVRDTHLYYSANQTLVAIRQGDWKLFLESPERRNNNKKKKANNGPAAPMLFNLADDPAETKDVLADHPEVVERLRAEAKQRAAEIEQNKRPIGQVTAAK